MKGKHKKVSDERGVAIIIALVMLLVMSILAISVSFLSNTDFHVMSNFKRGQEAFLAGETCIQETRRMIAEEGIAVLLFKQSSESVDTRLVEPLSIDLSSSNSNLITDSDGIGAICRSGNRIMDGENPDTMFSFPDDTRSIERVMRNTSLPDSGSGGAKAVPITFTVVGKDTQDEDKDDSSDEINTGTQIAAGIEVFTGGGAGNVY